jgi:hypothetical protein
MKRHKIERRIGFCCVLVIVALTAACSGDDDEARPCAEVLVDGEPTPDLVHQTECTDDDGELRQTAPMSYKCDDGSRLFAGEFGFGVEGEPWHADPTALPADGDIPAGSPLRKAVDSCQS